MQAARMRGLRVVVVKVVALVVAGGLAGCGLVAKWSRPGRGEADQEEGEKVEEAPVRLVGEIASVHRDEGFVLIRRYAQGSFGDGQLVASVGEAGTTCSLRLTGERMGRYYAADIQEGTPTKGDLVIVRRLPEEEVAPSTPLRKAPGGVGTAPWEKNLPEP